MSPYGNILAMWLLGLVICRIRVVIVLFSLIFRTTLILFLPFYETKPWFLKGVSLVSRILIFELYWRPSDSAQLTDLVGMYILVNIGRSFSFLTGRLYRDDDYFVEKDTSRPKLRRLEKELRRFIKVFISLM